MMELFDDRPKSEEAARIMQDKLLLKIDTHFFADKPLYLTGAGFFVFSHPISWQFLQSAVTLDERIPVYDRDYHDVDLDFDRNKPKFAIKCGESFAPVTYIKDQATGDPIKLEKWIGSICIICINEHQCRQGTMSCPMCGVHFRYVSAPKSAPIPGDTSVRLTPAPCENCGRTDHSKERCTDYWKDRRWSGWDDSCKKEAEAFNVAPPPPPVDRQAAASSSSGASGSSGPAPGTRQTAEQNSYYAEMRRNRRDAPVRASFAMDTRRQARVSQQHIKFAEDWMVRTEERDRWRRLQSRIGRSRFQTTMLSHRPWECRDPDQDPPTCNAQVLEYFKTMVSRFLSHSQWRRQFIHR